MAWSTPRTWVTSEVVSASLMNTHIRDNLNYLKNQVAAHFMLSAASLVPSATSGCAAPIRYEAASNDVNVMLAGFSDGATSFGGWTLVALPDDYNGGTVTAKFIWTHPTASGNSVVWSVQARAFGDGDAIDQAWGTDQAVTDAGNVSAGYTVRITGATGAITIGGTPAAGKLCAFRALRYGANASDTLASVAYLIGIVINYTRS